MDVFAITTDSFPPVTVGVAYHLPLQAVGGSNPYTWSLTGTRPKGITLSSRGLLAGKPKKAKKNGESSQTYMVTVSARTAASSGNPGLTTRQSFTLVVQPRR